MWELALVLATSALGCAAVVFFLRSGRREESASAADEPLRDDVVLTVSFGALAFVLGALRSGFARSGVRLGAFLALSVIAGAVATIVARRLRARAPASDGPLPLAGFGPSSVFHALLSSLLLGGLVAAASATSHALGDPEKLAEAVLPLVVGYAAGALLPSFGRTDPRANDDGAGALEVCAAMTLGVWFFERDGSLFGLRILRASALSLVFAPLVLRALFASAALAASFAFRRAEGEAAGKALGRAFYVGVTIAVVALACASFALLGPLALAATFAGTAGAAATVVA